VSDVEIWFAQKAELYWFLRSNAEIERILSCRKVALSETDFFNRIGRQLPVIKGRNWPLSMHWQINHVHPLAWCQVKGGCGS
jgi:hypothetical protein